MVNASTGVIRSEEHTSELQSLRHLVCRLLLEKKKKKQIKIKRHYDTTGQSVQTWRLVLLAVGDGLIIFRVHNQFDSSGFFFFFFFFFLMIRRPPRFTLFPSPPLFR